MARKSKQSSGSGKLRPARNHSTRAQRKSHYRAKQRQNANDTRQAARAERLS